MSRESTAADPGKQAAGQAADAKAAAPSAGCPCAAGGKPAAGAACPVTGAKPAAAADPEPEPEHHKYVGSHTPARSALRSSADGSATPGSGLGRRSIESEGSGSASAGARGVRFAPSASLNDPRVTGGARPAAPRLLRAASRAHACSPSECARFVPPKAGAPAAPPRGRNARPPPPRAQTAAGRARWLRPTRSASRRSWTCFTTRYGWQDLKRFDHRRAAASLGRPAVPSTPTRAAALARVWPAGGCCALGRGKWRPRAPCLLR